MGIPDPQEDTRLQVSLRIKAARHLRGARKSEGKREGAVALSTAELARHPVLVSNSIARTRIEDIEQMKVDARPMELEKLAEALEVPAGFLIDGRWPAAGGAAKNTTAESGIDEQLLQRLDAQDRALAEIRATLGGSEAVRAIQEAFEDYASRLGQQVGKRPPQSRRTTDPPPAHRAAG